MDYKQFADLIVPMTCIISVEKLEDGTYGNIRIVTGNDPYINGTEKFAEVNASDKYEPKFVPNSPYEMYIGKSRNFEDFCYRAAVLGQQVHTYICPDRFNFWISITMMPLKSDKENVYYCAYTQEFSKDLDSGKASGIDPEILSKVLTTCIKLSRSTENFSDTANEVVEDIRALCDANHCCILLGDFEKRELEVFGEAFGNDKRLKSIKAYINDEFFKIFESWEDTVAGNTCYIAKDAQDMEKLREINPMWYESLKMALVDSVVLFPLRSDNVLLGYMWALNFDSSNVTKIKDTLELTTFFLANKIANHLLVSRLETMSMMDMLTGVYNRNAMNNRVDKLVDDPGKADGIIGIVFADLNGLKIVNDRYGHNTGDMLLKDAALVLEKCFPDCEIYRAGGDEFMIIAPGMSEDDLMNCAGMIFSEEMNPHHVKFAVGCCSDSARNIRHSMRLSDERMYADKEKYYTTHPELKRYYT